MVMSVGLGAVAVKDRVDSDPGLGREAVRVAQIVGPQGVVDVLDVQPRCSTRRVNGHNPSRSQRGDLDPRRFRSVPPYPNATCDATPDERARDTLFPRESTNSDTLPATPRNIPGRKEARIC